MVYWGWLGSHPATIVLKYVGQSVSTWRILLRDRPDVAFVMSPPPIAALSVLAFCAVTGSRFVIDAHSGVYTTDRWRAFRRLHHWLSRRAVTTIVTNEHLAALVRSHGAHATVIADLPIHYDDLAAVPWDMEPFTVVFVTSFDRDEPLDAMVGAAARLPGVPFLMTGDAVLGARRLPAELPPNLTLTGFLPNAVYGAVLRRAGVVIALTTDDHTMQRGAFEAVYQGTPVIVSDTGVLRQAFDEGAVHVSNSADAVAAAIERVRRHPGEFRAAAGRLRDRKARAWEAAKAVLLRELELPATGEP